LVLGVVPWVEVLQHLTELGEHRLLLSLGDVLPADGHPLDLSPFLLDVHERNVQQMVTVLMR
jgi:hypothetical protein